jgi:hypothetical protein
MFNKFKSIAVVTTLFLTTGLFSCDKTQDIEPAKTGSARVAAVAPGIPTKTFRLAQVGKSKVTYNAAGQIVKADDGHHRIEYTYQAGNKILVSHFYENLLRWTTLIQLDANNRCTSSTSTDLTLAKKYVSDERTKYYTYNANGQLKTVNSYDRNNLAANTYSFAYYSPDDIFFPGENDIKLIAHVDQATKTSWTTAFSYGVYYQGGLTYACGLMPNKGNVNQVAHLSQWGAEPLSDIIDFFLPVYGVTPQHLYNFRWLQQVGGAGKVYEEETIQYSLNGSGYIDKVLPINGLPVPYTFEVGKQNP